MVHTGVMANSIVRQSVTLPANLAKSVRTMAKRKRTSASRMLVELLEEGIEARNQKEKAFYDLAGRFRAATDPKEAERLGEELGRMVFPA
jgi:metal-responsive CopG/Arc/MetJ family transcriptional regulator